MMYFFRSDQVPMTAIEMRMDPHERRECLVVFMPGFFDTSEQFREHGFLSDAAAASDRCDLVAADATFYYYRTGTVRQRVTADILRVAESRGYRHAWIVGVSMGGVGTMMVAQANPDMVRGAVLLAPFLGDSELIQSIQEAGGLEAWDAPDDADPNDSDEYDDALWSWMQGYATQPEQMPQLFIGLGEDDSLRPGVDLLAAVLPEERVGRVPGGHGWDTWRVLWRRLLESPPWDPGLATPSMRGR